MIALAARPDSLPEELTGYDPRWGKPHQSRMKAVRTGDGAEEQPASYSHHRVCFQTHRLERLNKEIEMELRQISSRNLGHDDWIIGGHGNEARCPLLNENIVSFLNFLPVWEKANLTLPCGIGEKPISCLVASELGLTNPWSSAKAGQAIWIQNCKNRKG